MNTKRPVLEMTESKEYVDAYTQHNPDEFISSHGVQTDEEPKRSLRTPSTQTEAEPRSIHRTMQAQAVEQVSSKLVSVEIQTETETETETEVSPAKDLEEDLTSSSSTIRPSTPRPSIPTDAPPSYDQALSIEVLAKVLDSPTFDYSKISEPLRHELKIAETALRHWHKGLTVPIEGLPEGISIESISQWEKLKREFGTNCTAIDKLIESSKKVSKSPSPSTSRPTHRHRFYNIYNTYLYNKTESSLSSYTGPILFSVFASAAVFLALAPVSPNAGPGMPTYQDRVYWSTFNSLNSVGGGFMSGQGDALWSVVGRLLLGGAEVVRRVNIPS